MSPELLIVLAASMLAGNAFFVGAEFGLIASRRTSIELEADNGSRAAKITLRAMEQVSIMLAGAQLGITLCSLIFGAVGEPLLAHFLEHPFAQLGISEHLIHPIAFVIALILLTFVHVVIGEMVPKNLALAGPTKAALWLTPPLVLFVKITSPVVHSLNAIANAIIRLLGFTPQPEITSSFTRNEVAAFVKESHKEGLLSKDERQRLSGALNIEHKTVASVLLPFDKLITVSPQASADEIEALSAQTGYSRFPVTHGKHDLKGYVHIKDLLAVTRAQQNEKISIKLVRELPVINLRTSLQDALFTMQQQGAHLAEVIDQKKKTVGVVALEDVLEELVGNIKDDA